MFVPATQPHVTVALPDPTWKVGPLTRRETAGLLAELQLHPLRARPVVYALIDPDTDRATLFLVDRFAQAWLALLLAPYARELLPQLPDHIRAETQNVLPSAWIVERWATKPRRGAA